MKAENITLFFVFHGETERASGEPADNVDCPLFVFVLKSRLISFSHYITFSHLADAFIQSDLQIRTLEAIKTNKRATTCKCYDKSCLA